MDDIQEETVVGNIIPSYISSFISPMEQEVMIVKDRVVLETESIEMAVKLRKKKEEISKEVKKKKFIFNTRGKLTKDEQKEMVRTHRGGVFDWFKKPKKIIEVESADTIRNQEEVSAEVQDDGTMVEVVREERISRMERRREEWECKC